MMAGLREVSLGGFDDARRSWRSVALGPEGGGGSVAPSAGRRGGRDLGGVFRYRDDPERALVWRALDVPTAAGAVKQQSQTVDVLEVALKADLENAAFKFKLPAGERVAKNGVAWFDVQGEQGKRLLLCIATTNGKGYCCRLRSHPCEDPGSEHRCLSGVSVLCDKRQSVVEHTLEKQFSFSSGPGRCMQVCCWFQDAKGNVLLAAAPDFSAQAEESTNGAPISCLCFDDEETPEFELRESTLVNRFMSGALSILRSRAPDSSSSSTSSSRREGGTLGADEGSANRVVSLRSVCLPERGTKHDDTFIVAVYGNAKVRVWSVLQKACCGDPVQLLADDIGSYVVESAWIEQVERGGQASRVNRDLGLAIGLHLSSGKSYLCSLNGSLNTTRINLEQETHTFGLDRQLLRGYRLIDITTFRGELYSVWWKPVSVASTLLLAHTTPSSPNKPPAVPYDSDRRVLLEQDRGALVGTANSAQEINQAFCERLSVPGRFSLTELRAGLISCFSEREMAEAGMPRSWVATSAPAKSSMLEAALQAVKFHTQRLASAGGLSRGGEPNARVHRQLLVDTWTNLIQECESEWLKGHQAMGLAVGPTGLTIVRRARLSGFRAADSVDTGLCRQESGPSPPLRRNALGALLETTRRCQDWLAPLLHRGLHPYDGGIDGVSSCTDMILESLTTRAAEVQHALQPVVQLGGQDPAKVFERLREALDAALPPASSAAAGGHPAHARTMMESDVSLRFRSLLVESSTCGLLQRLRERFKLCAAALFAWAALTSGRFYEYKEFFFFANQDGGSSLASSWGAIVERCARLSMLVWIGQQPPLQLARSLDWIKKTITNSAPPPTSTSFLSNCGTTDVSVSASVLGMWVDNRLPPVGAVRRLSDIASMLVESACYEGEQLAAYLDEEQQYQVLAPIASVCLAFGGPSSRVDPLFLNLLQAKSSLWRAMQQGASPSERSAWVKRAYAHIQVATPHYGSLDDERLRKYYMTAMDLFERAQQPGYALEFAYRALQLPNCSPRVQGNLCANIFLRALDVRDYRQAFAASRMCPRGRIEEGLVEEGDNYLAQLVSKMIERGDVKELCELPLQTCGEKVWRDVIMKALMRKIDEKALLQRGAPLHKPTYYHNVYAFCIKHVRFNEAAKCMFVMASQLQSEVSNSFNGRWDLATLSKLQEALQSCISTLKLIPDAGKRTMFLNFAPTYFWESPVQEDTAMSDGPDKCFFPVREAEVEKMFCLAKWACSLLRQQGPAAADKTLGTTSLQPNLLVKEMIRSGNASSATLLIKMFMLDATSLFRYLVQKNIDLPYSSDGWKDVQSYLTQLDWEKVVQSAKICQQVDMCSYKYHTVVLETILSLRPNAEIPQWLIASFVSWGQFSEGIRLPDRNVFAKQGGMQTKKQGAEHMSTALPVDETRDPGLLLRILVAHGRLKEACIFAKDLIAGILDEPMKSQKSVPYVPLRTLDLLLRRCDSMGVHSMEKVALEEAIQSLALETCEMGKENSGALRRNL